MEDLNPIFTTVAGAVRLSGLCRTTLYSAMKKGLIEARHHGRRTVIRVASLTAYLDSLPLYRPASGPDAIVGAA